ncbi:MAG TPA: diguanylate cyclase [Candidatus Lustribacter sp.]|jgi:diguanylate cyclase (GGDEF)-like protein/PAS domain S-box-containing protein|nr:diguanylate cyclase [Candidatus Lustribacter sp.]
MDAVSALLRAAIRIAGASAAIVAYDDDHRPVAFTGCSQGAAAIALRDGSGAYIDCRTPVTPMTLVLLEPARPTAGDPALMALANELGHAVLESAAVFDGELTALAASIETLADPVAVFHPPTPGEEVARFACVNGAFERLFGYASRDLAGLTEDLLFMDTTTMDNVMHMRDQLAAGEPVRGILELQTRESMPLWIEITSRVAFDAHDQPTYYVSTLRDISARKEFEAAVASEKQRLSVTLKAIGDAVITALPDGRIDFINAAAQRLLNVSFSDAYGMPLRSIVDLRDEQDAPCEIALDPAGDVRGEGLLYGPERNTQIAFVSSPMCGVLNPRTPFGYVIVLRDVTAQVRLTKRLAYEASHDSLTRLPNRRRFEEMIEGALVSARHGSIVHTIAFIDLDRFKQVNDSFGHETGDRFLRDVAHRMALNVRGNDILARLGGDEFALLLHECTPANAERVVEKIRQSVESLPVVLNGQTISLSASIGLAPLDHNAESAAAVLAQADKACYEAKARGGR